MRISCEPASGNADAPPGATPTPTPTLFDDVKKKREEEASYRLSLSRGAARLCLPLPPPPTTSPRLARAMPLHRRMDRSRKGYKYTRIARGVNKLDLSGILLSAYADGFEVMCRAHVPRIWCVAETTATR